MRTFATRTPSTRRARATASGLRSAAAASLPFFVPDDSVVVLGTSSTSIPAANPQSTSPQLITAAGMPSPFRHGSENSPGATAAGADALATTGGSPLRGPVAAAGSRRWSGTNPLSRQLTT